MYNVNTTLTKMLKVNELNYTSTDFAITPTGRAKIDTPVNGGNSRQGALPNHKND